MQSGGKSKRESWRSELPREGLGAGVLEKMKEEKRNDIAWRGKCSGTVYVCNYYQVLHLWFSHALMVRKLAVVLDFFSCFNSFCSISCSYIGGTESEGHFSLINEACSMSVRFGTSFAFIYLCSHAASFFFKYFCT